MFDDLSKVDRFCTDGGPASMPTTAEEKYGYQPPGAETMPLQVRSNPLMKVKITPAKDTIVTQVTATQQNLFTHNALEELRVQKITYHERKEKHERFFKKLKCVYYIIGFISVICSTITSFITGIYSLEHQSTLIVISLAFSLIVSILNAVSTFANFISKMNNHKDAINKYMDLISEITKFTLQSSSYTETRAFIDLITEKESLIRNYEELSCCF